MTTSYRTIRLDHEGAIARLTLERPAHLNGLSAEMHAELRVALSQIEQDASFRAVLLTGSGRAFCSGADIAEPAQVDAQGRRDLGRMLERDFNPLIQRLRSLPIPVVVAVNGVAAGAGVSLALAGDIVLAARSASFVLAFSRIGVMPDAGATWMLPRLVGSARAMGLCLLGESMGGQAAADAGMVWACVEDAQLMHAAQAIAQRLAAGPTLAYRHIKTALHAAGAATLEEQLALETRLQHALGQSEDCEEGVRAFNEKRPARFTGH